MTYKMHIRNKAFTALIAVIILATGTLAFSLAACAAAATYADNVHRREARIQARLNAASCVDTAKLMAVKDIFLAGNTYIPELGCTAMIARDAPSGSVIVTATAIFDGATASQ